MRKVRSKNPEAIPDTPETTSGPHPRGRKNKRQNEETTPTSKRRSPVRRWKKGDRIDDFSKLKTGDKFQFVSSGMAHYNVEVVGEEIKLKRLDRDHTYTRSLKAVTDLLRDYNIPCFYV
jgi:hypothetical protein